MSEEEKSSSEENEEMKDNGDSKKEKKKVPTIIFNNLQEVGEWINYLGGYEYLELSEPILDKEKKVLVQKNSSLRKSTFESLQKRDAKEISSTFHFYYNKTLKDRYKSLLKKSLYRCLEPKRYHIAPLLVKDSKIDLTKVGDFFFESKELLDIFITMDQDNDPLLPHLGEVALVSAGIAEKFLTFSNREEESKEVLKITYLAGLLHDIGLKGDSDFLVNDLEKAKESGHEQKGVDFIKSYFKNLDPRVGPIIALHHREEPKWDGSGTNALSAEQIASECINFTEYFFTLIRTSYLMDKSKRGENLLQNIFFSLGHSFGEGFFHKLIFKVINHLQSSFQSIMAFGEEIAKLEKKCLLQKFAVAYPVPLCTQILCRGRKYDCKLCIPARPINIMHYVNIFGRAENQIGAGQYPKCRLSEELPTPPKELSGI